MGIHTDSLSVMDESCKAEKTYPSRFLRTETARDAKEASRKLYILEGLVRPPLAEEVLRQAELRLEGDPASAPCGHVLA